MHTHQHARTQAVTLFTRFRYSRHSPKRKNSKLRTPPYAIQPRNAKRNRLTGERRTRTAASAKLHKTSANRGGWFIPHRVRGEKPTPKEAMESRARAGEREREHEFSKEGLIMRYPSSYAAKLLSNDHSHGREPKRASEGERDFSRRTLDGKSVAFLQLLQCVINKCLLY